LAGRTLIEEQERTSFLDGAITKFLNKITDPRINYAEIGAAQELG
jgi:hypothetical protein